jgi:hypothetical protein
LPQEQRSDVDIVIHVSGLTGSTIPRTSLPETDIEDTEDGEMLSWHYTNLIADRDIQITLPTKLSFSQRVAQLQDDFRAMAAVAPVFVGLSLLSLAGVFHLSRARLRIESYLLIGCGLALFYPMLTFLSGFLEVSLAACLSLMLILALLLAFIRLTTGQRNLIWRTALVVLVFLGFFSLGMLTPWRGMLLTGGSFLLLGTFMVLYAHRPMDPEPEPDSQPDEIISQPEIIPSLEAPPAISEPPGETEVEPLEVIGYHCPFCGRELQEEYSFCPECGRDARQVKRCGKCGHDQFLPPDQEKVYCLSCGEPLH